MPPKQHPCENSVCGGRVGSHPRRRVAGSCRIPKALRDSGNCDNKDCTSMAHVNRDHGQTISGNPGIPSEDYSQVIPCTSHYSGVISLRDEIHTYKQCNMLPISM